MIEQLEDCLNKKIRELEQENKDLKIEKAALMKNQAPLENNNVSKWLAPDAPVIENENGGKQSGTPFAFHMIPPIAMFKAAEVCGYGARKYGETYDNRNFTKIPVEEHVNHAIQHLYAWIAGDKSDDHLGHALVRCMFAVGTDKENQ